MCASLVLPPHTAQAVVLRLESEASEAREVARSEAARREASAAAQAAAALKDAKKTEAKCVPRCAPAPPFFHARLHLLCMRSMRAHVCIYVLACAGVCCSRPGQCPCLEPLQQAAHVSEQPVCRLGGV